MRNLFFKVFALILCSAVALFATVAAFFHFLDDRHHFDDGYEFVHEIAEDAVRAFEEDGLDELTRELDELFRHTGVRGFLMHGDGRAIGRPLPRYARERITHFPQTIIDAPSPRGKRTIRAVSVASDDDDDDRRYRFVMLAGHRSDRSRLLGHPATRFVMLAGHRNDHSWLLGHPATRFVMSLLVIALASLLISILITRPLGGLKSATRNFSEGNLGARAPASLTGRNDAFGELAREFDQMSARIEKLVGEHRRLLRDVSHELRSPLSRMQVAATLLEDNRADEADSHAQIARIQSEILRLDAMIAQLLLLTRLHAGAVEIELAEVDLKHLLEEVAQDAAYEFSQRRAQVEVRGDEARIQADADKLRSAFENVIRNGLRYTRSPLRVQVQLARGMAKILVADDGPGVPEQDLQNIFEPFYRPDQSRSEATGSTGIGLAIAKGIVEIHGGRIFAANATGGGLVVSIHLPSR